MRLFILLFLSIVAIHAQDNTKKIYAKIVAKNATLYQKPYECSKKKVAYYKRGDVIEIEYCNQYRWCKTKHGYLKRDLLSLRTPYIDHTKKIKKKQLNEKEKHVIIGKKSDLILQNRIRPKKIHLIPYKKKTILKDPYTEYFYKRKSAKLIIEDTVSQ